MFLKDFFASKIQLYPLLLYVRVFFPELPKAFIDFFLRFFWFHISFILLFIFLVSLFLSGFLLILVNQRIKLG